MSDIVRFGISLGNELLGNFDNLIKRRKYSNRSEAIRDLIRQELLKQDLEEDREVAGAITFVYDHHQRNLLIKFLTSSVTIRTSSSPHNVSIWIIIIAWRSRR